MFKNDKKLKPVIFDSEPPSKTRISEEFAKYKKPKKIQGNWDDNETIIINSD